MAAVRRPPVEVLPDVPKSRDNMSLTALGQFPAKDLERSSGLIEELGGRLDNESPRMSFPDPYNSRVNVGCDTRRLGPQRILVVVAVLLRVRRWMTASYDQFDLEGGAEGQPELLQRPWSIGQNRRSFHDHTAQWPDCGCPQRSPTRAGHRRLPAAPRVDRLCRPPVGNRRRTRCWQLLAGPSRASSMTDESARARRSCLLLDRR